MAILFLLTLIIIIIGRTHIVIIIIYYVCCRDMEEVRSILKECGDLITQAAGTVPGSLHIALSGGGGGAGGGGAEGEKMEMTVKSESMEVPGKESSEMNGVKVGFYSCRPQYPKAKLETNL